MKLGAENKRNVIVLCVLGLGAAYGIYSNFSDSSSTPSSKPATVSTAPPTIGSTADSESAAPRPARAPRRNEEWHPVVHPKNKEDQVAPDKIDPNIRLDLLAKVQDAKPAGSDRNLFEFGTAPKPKEVAELKGPEPVIKAPKLMGPTDLPPPPGPPPPPPPAPFAPLNAKYYGFATPAKSGHRRGFFMEGDNIIIKAEGEMLTKDYKIVKLESGSVTVQETTGPKRTKTLQMVEDQS